MALIPVICGPTAGGKSDLALRIAQARAAQGKRTAILAADAFQVYQGLDIASAKPTPSEQALVPHLLLDLVPVEHAWTASTWLAHAREALATCQRDGVMPLVVGGTHLYVKLLVDGLFEGPAGDEALRAHFRTLGLSALREELERVDPVAAARIHPNDERRTVRALEVHRLTGVPISAQQVQWGKGAGDPASAGRFLLIVLDWPTPLINRRINARVKHMLARGLVEETARLASRLGPTAHEALGTKQMLAYVQGRCSLEQAVEAIKIQTRRFAKNQRTWLKRLSVGSPQTRVLILPAALPEETLATETLSTDGQHPVPEAPLEQWTARVMQELTKHE